MKDAPIREERQPQQSNCIDDAKRCTPQKQTGKTSFPLFFEITSQPCEEKAQVETVPSGKRAIHSELHPLGKEGGRSNLLISYKSMGAHI